MAKGTYENVTKILRENGFIIKRKGRQSGFLFYLRLMLNEAFMRGYSEGYRNGQNAKK